MRVGKVAIVGLAASFAGMALAQEKADGGGTAVLQAPDKVIREARAADSSGLEKAAYLGISSVPVDPVLADQIGLPDGVGLVVEFVDAESPAAKTLQTHDVLKKFNDQILISHEQLAVLVRLQKPGDTIKLTVFRKGKETELSVTLGEKELPKLRSRSGSAPKIFFGPPEIPNLKMWMEKNGFGEMPPFPGDVPVTPSAPVVPPVPEVNKAGPKDTNHLKLVPGSSSHRVTVLGESHMNMIKESGKTYILRGDGKLNMMTVVGEDGRNVFEGPVNTDEERQKVPKEMLEKLQVLERSLKESKPHRLDPDGKIL